MAYATLSHVVAHHPARWPSGAITGSSVPNLTQVALLLDESSADLDFSLARGGYDSPLSSSVPSSVKAFFQKAAALGALCMLESGAQQEHNRNDFCSMFKEAKRMIESGQLPGLDKDDAESLPRYDLSGTPPFFTRDMCL